MNLRVPITSLTRLTLTNVRFNPVFVLPVPASSALTSAPSKSDPVSRTPGRRTGTGSANVSVSTRAPRERISIIGFQRLSLLNVLCQSGNVPPYRVDQGLAPQSFEAIRSTSDRPIVVFPECTTSNGRGLIRFCDVFNQNIPVQGWQVFVMCVRYITSVPLLTPSPDAHSTDMILRQYCRQHCHTPFQQDP